MHLDSVSFARENVNIRRRTCVAIGACLHQCRWPLSKYTVPVTLSGIFGIMFGINLAGDFIMKVVCAWCEREGKETLIGEIGLYDWEVTSHGICLDHEQVVLRQIRELKVKQKPRLRRQRHPRAKSESPRVVSGLSTICTTPWRRRMYERRMSAAQLSLPFGNGEV